jgi:GT2 family glycosyltransferase
MKLSVVIPTHDRPGTLRNTLEALAAQTLPAAAFEVLVVDDGSGAAERQRVRALHEAFDFELIEKEQGGLASARNLGAERASGEILHFLDDDVLPAPDSLEQHLASHAAESEAVAVVGALPFPPHVRMNAFLWYIERSGHYDLYKYPRKYPGGKPPMPPLNGNSSIRRELFFRIGKYDESFRRYGSEDLELGYRLARHGVRFVYNPRAVGYHDHTKSFAQFCRDMETAGESLIRVYRKYPDIKAPKKIDVVEDGLRDLPGRKKLIKIVMETTFLLPWLLAVPRWTLHRAEPLFFLRYFLFPLYRWVAHYHYAVGMRRGLHETVTP